MKFKFLPVFFKVTNHRILGTSDSFGDRGFTALVTFYCFDDHENRLVFVFLIIIEN